MSRQALREPRYQALADTLAQEVRTHFQPGQWLPGETRLARRFSVNRHTVRRALDELVRAGLVTRHQGLGTLVVDHRLDYAVSAASKVTHHLAERGIASRTECLHQALTPAPEGVAMRFGLGAETPLIAVDTLRWVDDAPLMRLRHWFDPERVPGWLERYRGGSTRALLDQHYGLRLHRLRVRIEANIADRDDQRLLCCADQAPLLQLTSDNVDADGTLVEVSISRARADRLAYHIDFPDSPTDEVSS
ncbi:phosphonate metabolism transcriptional regulator PhnF [Halomonas ventosae]|uniref:GntR family transcriptional regulator n=1 Tax=Halomonas ventosae TaxID=229007 RepID=A0A2T0VQG6_9GAMM|nr:phosphonate metabolism transcriptional regulator PhnF [Halomonas ventosae]PRY72729.1 GntR family transcriptional regulator [Halomonas ventosae]